MFRGRSNNLKASLCMTLTHADGIARLFVSRTDRGTDSGNLHGLSIGAITFVML